MNAIQVSCPNCGAKLRAPETSSVVTCEYCSTSSTIQRRTRFLERVVPPPAVTAGMRVATQRHSPRWILGLVLVTTLVPLVGVVAGIRSSMRQHEEARRRIEDATQSARRELTNALADSGAKATPAPTLPRWQGKDAVLVADVDGNGTFELIGRGRRVVANDSITIMAVDTATGKTLWESESLGTYSDTYKGLLVLAGSHVVFASETAELQAFDVHSGKRAWHAKLDERVKAFCASATADAVLAVGNDDLYRSVTLADGTVATAKPGPKPRTWHDPPPCDLLPSDDEAPFERSKTPGSLVTSKLRLGIDVEAVVKHAGGSIVAGARETGTRVTTIVALDPAGKERWRTTGAVDALAAEGAPRYVVAGPAEACILYYSKDYSIACFALADGARRWDVVAPSTAVGLFVVGGSLAVTTHRGISVLDLATGAVRWSRE